MVLACSLLFFLPQPAYSYPLLTLQQKDSLAQVCSQQLVSIPVTRLQQGIILFTSDNQVSSLHDDLPEALRANNFGEAGAVLCLEEIETELEICQFGLLFSIPRIRTDVSVVAYSLQKPESAFATGLLVGEDPVACNNAGIIDNSVVSIKGSIPGMDQIMPFLIQQGLGSEDSDQDGKSDLAEFIAASDPDDAASPGEGLAIFVNDSTNAIVNEGEALTISISLAPGQYKKASSDYRVYADSVSGIFSYIYPSGFIPVTEPVVAVTGPAINIPYFKLASLPALGVGDYTLNFELEVQNGPLLSSQAKVKVITSDWQFTEVSEAAGLNYSHGFSSIANGISRDRQIMLGGVAAGDYDNDGWVDLYITRGSEGANLLFRNQGDGSFQETGAAAGVDLSGLENSGALFADYDGDGFLDLHVTGINTTQQTLFHSNGDATFSDVTADSGFGFITQSMNSSLADFDKDGDLDMWITHWTANRQHGYLWRNNGDGTFTDISEAAGIDDDLMADFSVNFTDIDNDGWLDILVAADFGTSQVYINNGDSTFTNTTTNVISDENGMGSAVGDYDNDGDLDWFVSSIYDPLGERPESAGTNWGISGNRLYQNQGDGSFADVTDASGLRLGYWGWGSCFADFNNDGHLDLFHVNGYKDGQPLATDPFHDDPSRLFIADGQGGFLETSVNFGIDDTGQGRGIVCFDYDRDGDVDIFIANNEQPPKLFRNDYGNNNKFLHVQVAGEGKNTQAIGARIYVSSEGKTQMRELRAGNNFMSQNPPEAYFGLGEASKVDEVQVIWPSGKQQVLQDLDAGQLIVVPLP